MTQARRGDAGVTLIEVLVSLSIFAVIGLAGLGLVESVARTGERTEGRLERLAEIDRAFLVLRRDLAQAARGGMRLEADALRFRRMTGEGAIGVGYVVEGDALNREVARSGAPDPVAQTLLTGVHGARWRLLDGADAWAEDWPPEGGAARAPRAAELTLEVARAPGRAPGGAPQRVTRLFLLPAGHAQ